MRLFQRSTYGLCAAFLIAPLAVAQSECGDAVIVSSGDTLSKIARRCDTSVSALLDANRQLKDGNTVTAGSILSMPGTGSVTYSTAQASDDDEADVLAAAEIDELVAPIALYPDVLLSEILPGSTYPVEIVQAARWRTTHDDPDDADDADEQDWAPSIKALVRYPDALKMLNDDLDWTVRLGDAFLAQPDAVFDGIQRMRTKAEAAGNLKDTEQQVIVREKTEVVEVIRIVPANPRYVYVPYYDPYNVYYPYHGARVVHHSPAISFSTGFALGSWMNYGVNWRHRHIYHHQYSSNYYRRNNHRAITRVNRSYPRAANLEGRGERWRHNADRRRRHSNRAVTRNTSGNSQRSSNAVNGRRDAARSRISTSSRNEARLNRSNNRSVRERNQQTVNRARTQQAKQPRATASAARTPQTNATRTVSTNNSARNEVRRSQSDRQQRSRIKQQLNQRQSNTVRTRAPQSTRSTISRTNDRAVSRSSNQSQRQAVQPRASAPKQRATVRSDSVRNSRSQPAPSTSNRSMNVQRSQQSRPARQSSSRSESATRSQSRDRSSSRSNDRSGRYKER